MPLCSYQKDDFVTKYECSYDVHKFKYTCQKKFLIFMFIVLLLNEKLFMATVFEFVYVKTAPCFSSKKLDLNP